MGTVRAALVVAVVGVMVAMSAGSAQAADQSLDPDEATQVASEKSLASFAEADDARLGRTECEIERGEGGDEDWIIRIKHKRDADGPETSRCVIIPRKAKATPAAPKDVRRRHGHDERDAR